MKTVVAAVLAVLMLLGCSAATSEAPKALEPEGRTPGETLYEALRAGSFNLGAAQESLREAYAKAKTLADAQLEGSELKSALQDLADLLDSAGSMLVDHSVPPPGKDEVEGSFGTFDEGRLKAVEAANDALHDLREARGIADGLYEGVPGLRAPLDQLSKLTTVAEEDLLSALGSLGGRDEASS